MEPVKWSQQKSRDVLNEAIEGNISDDLLAAASDAVKDGYEGSLARQDHRPYRASEDAWQMHVAFGGWIYLSPGEHEPFLSHCGVY